MAGALIGPAWQAMWDEMADGEWHARRELENLGAAASGVLPKTARNLLMRAAAVKIIERRQTGPGKFAPVEVRRNLEG